MNKYKITVKYKRNNQEEKEIILESNKHMTTFIIDSFILEEVIKSEEPNLLSIYPLIKDILPNNPATHMPTNIEIMNMHGILDLTYEIDGRIFYIST